MHVYTHALSGCWHYRKQMAQIIIKEVINLIPALRSILLAFDLCCPMLPAVRSANPISQMTLKLRAEVIYPKTHSKFRQSRRELSPVFCSPKFAMERCTLAYLYLLPPNTHRAKVR